MTAAKQDPINPHFLKIPQVTARLQLNQTRVYELVRAGIIPSVRIGGSIRVPRPALERWIDQASGVLL